MHQFQIGQRVRGNGTDIIDHKIGEVTSHYGADYVNVFAEGTHWLVLNTAVEPYSFEQQLLDEWWERELLVEQFARIQASERKAAMFASALGLTDPATRDT